MKKEIKIVCFLVMFLLISKLTIAQCPCGDYDEFGNPCPCPQEETKQQITENIENTISTGGSVDLSDPLYKDNPDIVKEVIKDKYNLDLDNIKGAKIDGNILTTSDGSKIDLTTGKSITVETDGSLINHFDDGSGTACTNCKGITYTENDFRVEAGDKVDYYGSTSTAVSRYEAKIGTFSAASAGSVAVGANAFANVRESTFSIIGGKLAYADVKSAKGNNTAVLENPIQGSSEKIRVEYASNSSFEVQILPSQIDFTLSKGILLNMTKITFRASQDNAKLKIEAANPPKYLASRGTLSYMEDAFSEQLNAECELSAAEIGFSAGFRQVTLSPFVTALCPGARYSYIAKDDREKSYSILNTGRENYLVGFYKEGLLPYDDFAKAVQSNSWGYVRLPESIELNAITSYERCREFRPEIESYESYNAAEPEFMPVYKSLDYGNMAMLGLIDGKNIGLAVSNPDIDNKTDVIVEVNSGFHKIIEKQASGSVFRLESFNRQPMYPPYITKYSSDFGEETPFVSITGKTLSRICGRTQAITVFTPNTEPERAFRDRLQGWAAVSYDEMLGKYGPQKS